jgi:DNA invertase Pin-like site-specific DNA recombinase
MGHRLSYARVSTTDQKPDLRIDALERADCYRVLAETASDGAALEQVLDHLGGGDILGGVGTRLAESVAAPPG